MNNEVVQCGNLKFKKLYTREQIDSQVDKLAAEMDEGFQSILLQDPKARFLIVGVLNGAFMFTSEIVKRLKTPVLIEFIKIKSYRGEESGQVSIDYKLDFALFKDSHVIILDDICDTGKTLAQLSETFKQMEAKSVKIGVLVVRPDKVHEVKPDFAGLTCNEFIIGYGLDYNLEGRQYP